MSRIWFVAAGTGGHIFPGVALANEIKRVEPAAEILFFGSKDRLEAQLVPKAGYPIHFLAAAPWKGRGIFSRLMALVMVKVGFFQVLSLMMKGRPDVLVSVGGYISVPTALAAWVCRVPLILLEPNIRAGLANRLISRLARKAFCAPGSDALKVFTCPVEDAGNPIREDIRPVKIREEVKTLLILGGSQGAMSLCQAGLRAFAKLTLLYPSVRLVLQAGAKNQDIAQSLQKELGLGEKSQVLPFIDNVPEALSAADIVVARAGAMTVAELCASGLPTVFVPFPFAADDHQRLNARLLVNDGASLMVDEKDGDLTEMLTREMERLCGIEGRTLRPELSNHILRWARPRATQEIAQQILSMRAPRG